MSTRYWRDDPQAPFATMLRVISHYCHPEAHDEAFEELTALTRRSDPPERLVRFKEELRQVLSGNRDGLPPKAVFAAASYDDGSDEAFLQRLWHDLYPDEPVPAPPTG